MTTPLPPSARKSSRAPEAEKNLEKVLASLNTVCPKCGFSIAPEKIRRIDSQWIMCPECGERFGSGGISARPTPQEETVAKHPRILSDSGH